LVCRAEHEPWQECDPFSGSDERLRHLAVVDAIGDVRVEARVAAAAPALAQGRYAHRTTNTHTCALTLDQSYALHELKTPRVSAPEPGDVDRCGDIPTFGLEVDDVALCWNCDTSIAV